MKVDVIFSLRFLYPRRVQKNKMEMVVGESSLYSRWMHLWEFKEVWSELFGMDHPSDRSVDCVVQMNELIALCRWVSSVPIEKARTIISGSVHGSTLQVVQTSSAIFCSKLEPRAERFGQVSIGRCKRLLAPLSHTARLILRFFFLSSRQAVKRNNLDLVRGTLTS